MFSYDYTTAYMQGNLSEFLYEKAKSFDKDGVNGLNKIEYNGFQAWLGQEDYKKYNLDKVEVSFKEKVSYYDNKNLPEEIKKSDIVSEKEKNILKNVNRIRSASVMTGLAGAILATAGSAAGRPTIAAGIGYRATLASAVAIALTWATSAIYQKHLEKKIEKAEHVDLTEQHDVSKQ